MLQAKQGLTSRASQATQAASPAQPQPHVKQSPGPASLHEQPGLSLSELSVHDPGMKDPQAWLLAVQKVGLVCHDEAACCQKDLQSAEMGRARHMHPSLLDLAIDESKVDAPGALEGYAGNTSQ